MGRTRIDHVHAGHDIAADLANHGNGERAVHLAREKGTNYVFYGDVTMFQRSSTFVMSLEKSWRFLGGGKVVAHPFPIFTDGFAR